MLLMRAYLMWSGFFLLVLFIFFPSLEFIFLTDFDLSSPLFFFILFQFFSIAFCFVFLHGLGVFRKKNVNFVSECFYAQKLSFYIALIFFLIFMSFYLANFSGLSDVFLFAEAYRNGVYKGSGLFTAGMIQIVPMIIAVLIAKSARLSIYFYLALALLMFVSFLLGLRIILFVVFFFYFVRVFVFSGKLKSIFILLIGVFFFVSFKIFLTDELSFSKVGELIFHVVGRIRYRFLIQDSAFEYSFHESFGFLPFINSSYYSDLSSWKEFYTTSIDNVFINMPHVNLYSGMAYPLPLILFNSFGLMGFVFVVPFLFGFFYSARQVYSCKSFSSAVAYVFLTYFFLAVLVEDIYQFDKALVTLFIFILVRVYFHMIQLRFKGD